jgi:YfiH family protein
MTEINLVVPTIFQAYPEVLCGVSTRGGGVSPGAKGLNLSYSVGDDPANVAENRRRLFSTLGAEMSQLVLPKQVHGNTVREVNSPGSVEACDALVTAVEGLILGVSIADCLPGFLYDPRHRCVAAVHAGWRGSKLRVLEAAARFLVLKHGAHPSELIAYLGPSAGPCCYEVGEEVAREFDPSFLLRGAGKPRLDLKAFNRQLLLDMGVPASRMEVSDQCTICDQALFHSYRRDGADSGRMIGIIGLSPPPPRCIARLHG